MFHFKQFSVDQTGCAMKINTDGVLLGAMVKADNPQRILDIGTGTGVISLMLAQRFDDAIIDAVEIDEVAAATAAKNFVGSPFHDRLKIYPNSFELYFKDYPESKYDIIVANPPFYIHSLKSPKAKKNQAKHTDEVFFKNLIETAAAQLTVLGALWLVLPIDTADLVIEIANRYNLFPHEVISVNSFVDSSPHRLILCFRFNNSPVKTNKFIIYESQDIYSDDYKKLLQPYFIAF